MNIRQTCGSNLDFFQKGKDDVWSGMEHLRAGEWTWTQDSGGTQDHADRAVTYRTQLA